MTGRPLPTLLTLVVALVWGAIPLRECHASDGCGGSVVVAGEHAHGGHHHDADHDGAPCGDDGAPCSDHRDAPCCVDSAPALIGPAAASSPAVAAPAAVFALCPSPTPCLVVAAVRAPVRADPGGPPDGVATVVLLR